ncbi:MAG: hypothetical protein COU40_00415 [Candidatus Moranbacteria bacterium CG10_big_fil_rev_8_21_14_0_10_35_21]|nr:MAG: hypothetical protein COU40_00415 [Candidatus Moranbacteria bacterium CG10_big_fil_rev_8_21_14_0_10_35_21]PJA88234.1 MAG: hypothetical protein CO139_04240 [Candidatus Moranbacteria bacterium CG_4_9_14_3_um_filter_36_9]
MLFKSPKNNEKYQWTQHSIFKLQQYGLSPQRITRVIRNPQRKEAGIVENTIAVMQSASVNVKNGKKTWSQEIWAMYQTRMPKKIHPVKSLLSQGVTMPQFNRVKIISAWRYPGISPKNNPIPEEILSELSSADGDF